MNPNLSWLIVNWKQFQFWKSKILFSCYDQLNSEPFVYSPVDLCKMPSLIYKLNVCLVEYASNLSFIAHRSVPGEGHSWNFGRGCTPLKSKVDPVLE